MILTLNVHYTRASDLVRPDYLVTDPPVPVKMYRDGFGNWCSRIVAPPGRFALTTDAVINDRGEPDRCRVTPSNTRSNLFPRTPSCSCSAAGSATRDHLSTIAWNLFGKTRAGWARVQAICDFVHERIAFGYEHARATQSASEAYQERHGVCRDFAHLAIAFCRCLEHPGALLHGVPGRRRRAAAVCRPWISRPGSRPISAANGTRSTRATMCRASAGY